METRVTIFMLQTMLWNQFRSKKEMAVSLDIQYRMLLRVFSSARSKRDLRVVMDRIVHYHIQQGIPMANALQSFFNID